jgi:hypothetical protein
MKNEVLFVEQQRLRQWWVWALLIAINGGLLFECFRYWQSYSEEIDPSGLDTSLLVAAALSLLVSFSILAMRLETRITEQGIYFRFFPFQIGYKHYPWNAISNAYVRTYSALAEYGGWGIRFGIFGRGMAFILGGNQGLQLELISTKKRLIGTQKPDEMAKIISEMGF